MPPTKSAPKQTPRTDELIMKLQSTPIPFEVSFWQLLDLTRTLERENTRLRKKQKELKKQKTV